MVQDKTAILILITKQKETEMKSMLKGQNGSRGFTIIELLTVMSVIILLMGLFMPAMNMVRRYARRVAQHNQFHAIEVALAMFNAEWQEYPDPTTGSIGVGAVSLAESMVGRDLLGYDPDGTYDQLDLSDRRPYLEAGNANANPARFYPGAESLYANIYVLSDVYPHVPHPTTGRPFGMPILYYKANVSNYYHSKTDADAGNSIYKYQDNHMFVYFLSIPGDNTGRKHALVVDPPVANDGPELTFYEDTRDHRTIVNRGGEDIIMPYRASSYILLSAGFDGEYGTDDDVYNFSN